MRFYYLQFARFFAASIVVLFHKYYSGIKFIDFIIGRGDVAVTFFFILSGFVITNSLLRKPLNFKEYVFRRSLKIMPQWFLSILISVLVIGGFGISFFRVLLSILLLQTFYPAYSLDLNFVGWSLSVELIMYLVLFVTVTYVNVKSSKFSAAVWVVWFLTQAAYLYLLSFHSDASLTNDNFNFFLHYHPVWHLSSFLIGILSAVSFNKINVQVLLKIPYPAFFVSLIYVAILVFCFFAGYKAGINRFYHNGFFAPITGIYIILICNIEKQYKQSKKQWKNKLFDVLGGISFGIYLFHIPIYNYLNQLYVVGNSGYSFWAYFVVVLIFSYFAFKLLDEMLHRITYPLLFNLRSANGS